MNTTFRTVLCSALLASIISSAQPMDSECHGKRYAASKPSDGACSGTFFSKTVWGTGITATLLAIAGYTGYRLYKNKMASQTVEGKVNTATTILNDISKDTLITDATETENGSNLTLQATKLFTESQFPLILAQNYLVAQAAQLATADRCVTEARDAIKNALENKKTSAQEKDRLNKLDDTCRQIKKHITAYNDLIDKKLTTLIGSDGYEVQLALYAQADAVRRDGWWKGTNLITYSVLAVIGMIVVSQIVHTVDKSTDENAEVEGDDDRS
jgi:hypothetical protein